MRQDRARQRCAALTLPSTSGIVGDVADNGSVSPANGSSTGRLRLLWRWFQPGLGVKRWFVLMVIGTTAIGLGVAVVLLDIYRAHPGSPWLAIVSLAALPRWLRAVIFGSIGFGLVALSIWQLNRTLLAPYLRPGKPLVEAVAAHRRRKRGPHIVAIGGGTGLSTLLRGLKKYSDNLTAIVTVADDGGSSGRLRRSLGLPPPGDLRSCLAALSNDEDLLTQLFQYRFRDGDELGGHSFGNLFIAALTGVTGSFEQGVLEAGRVLAIQGKVLPATLQDIALVADKLPTADVQAVRVEGESRIPMVPGRIRRVQLEPNDPPAYPGAIRAVLNADMIVIGPGSLYTSVLPNLLVPDLLEAIRASKAFKVYVCNVATQPGETDFYSCDQHVAALLEHVGGHLVDLVLANDCLQGNLPDGIGWVQPPGEEAVALCHCADLVDRERPWRHDSAKLADALIALLEERTGPLSLEPADQADRIRGLS